MSRWTTTFIEYFGSFPFGLSSLAMQINLFFILRTEPIETLMEMAKQKDPGFDLYWFCAALKEVDEFPDAIAQWPVDMLIEVDVIELKNKFLDLAREIMDKIREAREGGQTV